MIISRTPLRMSFVGGGTDLPAFYRRFGGAVVSTAINQFSKSTDPNIPQPTSPSGNSFLRSMPQNVANRFQVYQQTQQQQPQQQMMLNKITKLNML